ncbi:MAG: SOS response-associated peptidase [Candidatus Nitronauta litoralis]|uniref:Abasic site processing protein n=1 Tax=Candidatus Nitronauta litoralis TaxID=2705533 RepID=A0A7T0BYY5_9BACT|nr:MAG: SOS response-associated peptidase [Candidatus Nitronauta litoralis]
MCGRYSLSKSIKEIAEHFKSPLIEIGPWPRFNIAPTQSLPVVTEGQDGFEIQLMKWGLVPHWAKDASLGSRMINARAETVAEKPSFRDAFKSKRCLIPCDGFYEWVAGEDGKTPHYIHMKGGQLFALAGIWSEWTKGETPLQTYSIITTEANEYLTPLHHRMPVILKPDQYSEWMQKAASKTDLLSLLNPLKEDALEYFPVSKLVNSPKNDSAECIFPAVNE